MNAYPMLRRCRELQRNFQNNMESAELWSQLQAEGLISTERFEDWGERLGNEQAQFERAQVPSLESDGIEAQRFEELFGGSE